MSDAGQVWERRDGMLVVCLDDSAVHERLSFGATVHCLVVNCPPNHFPEGCVLLLAWPPSELWSRVV